MNRYSSQQNQRIEMRRGVHHQNYTASLQRIINKPCKTDPRLLFHEYHQEDCQHKQFCSCGYSFCLQPPQNFVQFKQKERYETATDINQLELNYLFDRIKKSAQETASSTK